MIASEVVVRGIGYAAAMLLFGASAFLVYAPRQAFRTAGKAGEHEWRALCTLILRIQIACALTALASGALWLMIHAAIISASPLDRVLSGPTLGIVVRDTLFGRVAALRLALALVLATTFLLTRRGRNTESAASAITYAALSGGLLAMLAWSGHAAATPGWDGDTHLSADVVHLLAAGGWLGALPPLAWTLARAARASASLGPVAVQTASRFSRVGMLCVGALALTGLINAEFLVSDLAALFGTPYGQLLLLKLFLLALMVFLALRNRMRLLPQLRPAARRLPDSRQSALLKAVARNAGIELALGLAIALIVGALGVMVPAAHAKIMWPFPVTFGFDTLEDDPALRNVAAGLLLIGIVAAGLAAFAIWRRAFRTGGAAVVASAAAITVCGYFLARPAFPTTYQPSPLGYTASSIAHGRSLYAAHCAACHGEEGYGDGVAASSLAVRPANLAAPHILHHRPGDIFWWLSYGIAGTPMPGFAEQLTETQRWQLVNFVYARAEAEEAVELADAVGPWRPIVAPDFDFETAGGAQESLSEQRGHPTLLVFYTLPASAPRLSLLAREHERLAQAGVRVIALSRHAETPSAFGAVSAGRTMLAVTDPQVADAYSLFFRTRPGLPSSDGEHVELLVDRDGYLRARQIGTGEEAGEAIANLLRDADRLRMDPPHPSTLAVHHH